MTSPIVLAEAVQLLWPGLRTAIGPAIEHGLYYDFDRKTPFTPDDLPEIEAVTSRQVIWPFLEPVWFEFVSVLFRLQGRLAAEG